MSIISRFRLTITVCYIVKAFLIAGRRVSKRIGIGSLNLPILFWYVLVSDVHELANGEKPGDWQGLTLLARA